MPITPKDAAKLSMTEQNFIERAESLIDEKLKSTYLEDSPNWKITISFGDIFHATQRYDWSSQFVKRVMWVIQTHYEKLGWRFEVKSDQREGEWIEIRGPQA